MHNLENLQVITLPPITQLDLIKYAGASGDYNPIHLFEEEAKKTGLKSVIAHGMLNMSRMSILFTPLLDIGYVSAISTRFTGMIYLDDVITIIPTLIDVEGNNYNYKIIMQNQNQQPVLQSSLVFTILQNREA